MRILDPWIEYVYIVRVGAKYKVGHTWNLSRRVKEFKGGELVFSRRMRAPHASRVECATRWLLHRFLLPGMGREWFSRSPVQTMKRVIREKRYSTYAKLTSTYRRPTFLARRSREE